MKLTDFKVLTFDVYGTLIDWETGMVNGLKLLTDKVNRTVSRNEILEAHAHYESLTQRYTPSKIYSETLATVYKRLAEEWGIVVPWSECLIYGASVEHSSTICFDPRNTIVTSAFHNGQTRLNIN